MPSRACYPQALSDDVRREKTLPVFSCSNGPWTAQGGYRRVLNLLRVGASGSGILSLTYEEWVVTDLINHLVVPSLCTQTVWVVLETISRLTLLGSRRYLFGRLLLVLFHENSYYGSSCLGSWPIPLWKGLVTDLVFKHFICFQDSLYGETTQTKGSVLLVSLTSPHPCLTPSRQAGQ